MRRFILLNRYRPAFWVLIGLVLAVGWTPARKAAAQVAVDQVISPGGIEAWLVTDRTNPVLSLELVFDGGAAVDPDDKLGLARLTAATLDEGAGALDSQAFQGRLDDLAIALGFNAGRDGFAGSLRTLTATRAEAFRLLRLALTAPRFDAEPVARMKRQLTARLKRQQQDPDSIAARTFWRVLYPDHPYGRPPQGTAEGLAAITVADLRGFVRDRLARDRLILGVTGDIDAATLGPLLDETFGGLPATGTAGGTASGSAGGTAGGTAGRIADAAPAADGRVLLIDRDIPQSIALFGQAGLMRSDPDYYAAVVLNHILGGGSFQSRLYQEVREKRGLAYGVYSYLAPLDHSALIMGRVATQNERVAESLALIAAEWRRMRDSGVTAAELSAARTYLTGSFPLRFTSTGRIAGILVAMQRADLGIDYLDRRNGLIEAVTREDVARVAQRLLDPDALTTVIIGRPQGLDGATPAPDDI